MSLSFERASARLLGLLSIIALFALCLFIAPLNVRAADTPPKPPLAAAAEAFRHSDWPQVIQLYREVIQQGAVDPNVFYNLGTAYAQAGDPGRALWMLLRARRLAPRDPDIRKNLDLVAEKHAPNLSSQNAMFPFLPLQALYAYFTLNEWATLGGIATAIMAMALTIYFALPPGKSGRRFLKQAAIIAGLAAAVGHLFAGVKYYEEAYSSRGIVVEADTHPYPAPSESGSPYDFVLPAGTIFRVENSGAPGWIKAIYGSGNQVFIRRSQMEYLQTTNS